MAMTWATLTAVKTADGSIASWVNRRVPATEIIQDAEAWLNQRLRAKGMLQRVGMTMPAGENAATPTSFPDGAFLDAMRLFLIPVGAVAGRPIYYVDADQIDELRYPPHATAVISGAPVHYTTAGAGPTFYFDTTADVAYSLALTYFAAPLPLSVSQTTSVYTALYPQLFKQVCTALAYRYWKDEKAEAHFAQAEALIEATHQHDKITRPETNARASTINYTQLIGSRTTPNSIRSWVQADVPSAEVVADTENWLNTYLRTMAMQARATLTLAEDVSSISLSASLPLFLDPLQIYMQGYGDLRYIAEDDLDRLRGADENGAFSKTSPSSFAIIGNTLYFDVAADQDYTLVFMHYAKPLALSAANLTNAYTTDYRNLFKLVATAFARLSMGEDDKFEKGINRAQAAIQGLQEQDDLRRRSQSYDMRVS